MEQDIDQWKYISLVANKCITYDFKFKTRSDVSDFIIAVSKATKSNKQSDFVGVTNRSFVTMMLLREKLSKIAKNSNTTVHGLFIKAIFLTV